jgi:hypothetical protein
MYLKFQKDYFPFKTLKVTVKYILPAVYNLKSSFSDLHTFYADPDLDVDQDPGLKNVPNISHKEF